MTIEDLKDCYKFELERKDKLSTSLTLPVGVLTIIGGLLGLILRDFSFREQRLSWFFGVAVAAGAILFVVSVVLIILAYYRYRYEYVPTPREMREHEEKLQKYYEQIPGAGKDLAAQKAAGYMETMIAQLYEDAISANAKNNDTKSAYIHNASSFLIGSLTCVMIATIPYTIDARGKGKEVYEVKVVNPQVPSINSMEVKQDANSGTGQDGRSQAPGARTDSSTAGVPARPQKPEGQRELHSGAH